MKPELADSGFDFWLLFILATCGLILLNGLFIAAETAADLLRSLHVKHVKEEAGAQSLRLQDLIDNRQRYVTACLLASRLARLGIFLVVLLAAPPIASFAYSRPVADLAYVQIVPWALVAGIPVIFLNLIVGELVPRSYASLHPHRVGVRLYPMIRFATILLSVPATILIGLANLFTRRFGGKATFGGANVAEEEIKNLAESAEETGEIESEERELIHSVLEFNDTTAREIMTPRVDLDAMPVRSTMSEVIHLIKESGHSRIPLYEETDDQIVGIVHAKDLMIALESESSQDLRKLMRPPMFVPEGQSIRGVLQEMRVTKTQMAIVQDEFGGTAGVITTEDIVEQLVGEIVDEYDEDEATLEAGEGFWHVSGKTHLDDVNDAVGSEFEDDEFDTVGGFVFGQFGRQPRQADFIDVEGYRFTVEDTDGRRIRLLRIERCPLEEPEPADTQAARPSQPLF